MTARMAFAFMSIVSISTTFAVTLHLPATRHICRDRLGVFYEDHFKVTTCAMCYFYIIKDGPKFKLNRPIRFKTFHTSPYYLIRNETGAHGRFHVFPSTDNQTAIDTVCDTLNESSCASWQACCKAAWDCCQLQMNTAPPPYLNIVKHCPQTFDGWLCWNFTQADRIVKQGCPSFLIQSQVSGQAVKHCSQNGTWETDNVTGLERTDYNSCSQADDDQLYKKTIIVGVVLNIFGLVLIVPAIAVFLVYRGLRKQQRIQIHINFFLSILLTSISSLVWDIAVRLDRISSTQERATLYSNQALCKTLHVLYKWSHGTIFFWMTCEGYFLHRLMVNAFLPPKHFYGYLLFGWGSPCVLLTIYSAIRKTVADDSICWLLPLEGSNKAIEWLLIYIPTMLCIFINTLFLISILKQLLTKMVIHPNEPSTFRRALRATFILIPLFGLHLFCLIYRPSSDETTQFYIYEFVSAVILNSQGIVISTVFCYFNNEVQGYIRTTSSRLKLKYFIQSQAPDRRKSSESTKSESRKTSVSSLQISTSERLQNGHSMNGIDNGGFTSSDIVETTSL